MVMGTSDPTALTPHARLMLLWIGVVVVVVLIPFVVLAIRRAIFGSMRSAGESKKRAKIARIDAWVEAGRRTPDEPGGGRLDDTVDLDPFGPNGEDRW